MTTAVKCQHRDTELGQHGRQKTCAAGVKIYGVAMKIQRGSFGSAFAFIRLVKSAIDGIGIGLYGDELGAQINSSEHW